MTGLFKVKFLEKNNDYKKIGGKSYKSKISEEELKSVNFLDKKFVELPYLRNKGTSFIPQKGGS